MLSGLTSRGRKALSFAKNPEERWRYILLASSRLAKDGSSKNGWNERLSEVLIDRMLTAMRQYPQAVVPVSRQLKLLGRIPDAMAVVETVWDLKAKDSAEWALACAEAWYEAGFGTRGDAALALALEIAPDWAPPYEVQALNRSKRGHMAFAVDAAQRVIELGASPEATRYWSAFIGAELFRGGDPAEALTYLERGESETADWVYWYQRAVCNERNDRTAQAAECYEKAGNLRLSDLPKALRLGALHYYQGEFVEAAKALGTTPLPSPNTESQRLALLGRSLLRLERAEEAIEHLRARDRQQESADLAKVSALAEELAGNADAAIDEYRSGVDRHYLSLDRRLARALHSAGRIEEAVAVWKSLIPAQDSFASFDSESDPSFIDLSRTVAVSVRNTDWAAAIPALRRLAASASSLGNVQRIYGQLGHALAADDQLEAALNAFMRTSQDLVAHPSEVSPDFAPLGIFEQYAAAYETLPVEQDVVLYEAFHGARIGCNPLALCRYLLEERPELRHVWAIQDDAEVHHSLRDHPRVSFVRIHSDGYRLHLATAGTLINNNTFPQFFIRREQQRYLNTWHGIPWKTLGRDITGNPFFYDNIARNLLQASHLAFPDEHTTRIMLETQAVSRLCRARVTVAGQPRMDVTLTMGEAEQTALRQRLGADTSGRTILYAPTWRGENESPDVSVKPYVDTISALARVSSAQVLLRVHYIISSKLDLSRMPRNVTVVPEDVDTNELLAVTDVLVSDYSSLIFDYAALNRPIIKYVYDIEDYSAERGLYFSIDEVPGNTCTTESELIQQAREAVQGDRWVDWSNSPTASTWLNDDGHATERVASALFDERSPQGPAAPPDTHRVLVTMGALQTNGITRSLRNLIASDAELADRIQLVVPKAALNSDASHEAALELAQAIDIIPTVYRRVHTRRENLAWQRLVAANQKIDGHLREVLRGRMQRERRRLFGETQVTAAVDFDGYNLYQSLMIALGFPSDTKTVYVMHNDFEREWRLKFPNLKSTGRILDNFDTIASVSEPTRKLNRDNLESEFSVPPDLHVYTPNTINISSILSQSREEMDSDLSEWLDLPGTHILVVARLSVEKNQVTVLDAMAELAKTGESSARVMFLGEGPSKAKLVRHARDIGVSDRVFFAGHRSNPYPVMKRVDALLLPSLHEGQPMVLLEAMTLGTPVVSTSTPGPSALLQEGRFGLLVEPTLGGVEQALTAIVEDRIVTAAAFDPHQHQEAAINAFKRAIGEP